MEKVGLVIVEKSVFYKKPNTHASKYGHRKPLEWETQEEIEKTYQIDDAVYEVPKYILCPTEDLVEEIRTYIMSKHPFENAQQDRECNTEKLSKETAEQYKETITFLTERFQDILEIMEEQFYTTLNFRKTHTATIDTGIITKLEVIHTNVEKTNENQIVLRNVTLEIQEDVNAIKTNQGTISEKQDNLQKTIDERSLSNELRGILRKNDFVPSIKQECEKSVKKVEKEVKRFIKKF